jgi:glycine/D-amino acid oxidase-like deaminating enzyme/nitrite reductase/ring-hydroxylating ferredoxin subunit
MQATQDGSIWQRTAPGPGYPRLEGDLDVDVVLVGGGITGITAALRLKEAGLRVVVLDAHTIASGVTGATTAHFTEALDTRYAVLATKFGRNGARLAAQSQRAAIEHVADRVARLGLACDFRKLPAYLYAEPEADQSEIELEYEASRSAGLSVSLLPAAPLPWATGKAVRYEAQATLHPREYVLGLAARIPGDGSHVFEHTRVTDWKDGEPCEVFTAGGTVRAKSVFLATHEPITKVFLQTKVSHYRSYVLALRTRLVDFPDALFFDTEDPYHYIRRFDRDGATWLIVGGEDHKTGQEKDTRRAFQRLERWCDAKFDYEALTDAWSSQVVEPVDGLPFVGLAPTSHHVYVATGFSGNGMTHGTMSALLVSDLVLGRTNPWADLYKATRMKLLASASEFVRENVDFPAYLVSDRVTSPEATSVAEIPSGEGRIVQVGGRKLAVYRDEEGSLSALSPVCTHLYCHVNWNSAERSWDCPCHGSRFDTEGEIIEGPAVHALAHEKLPDDLEDEREPERRPGDGGDATITT